MISLCDNETGRGSVIAETPTLNTISTRIDIMPTQTLAEKPFRGQDLTGKRFGKLTARKLLGTRDTPNGSRLYIWLCHCDCGNEIKTPSSRLKIGHTASCGCSRKETLSRIRTTHGMSSHPAYQSWLGMWARCTNPKSPVWKYYGGRGINVCESWKSFSQFWKDMEEGWRGGLEIDRIKNNGNYCASNCKWSTRKEQMSNTSRSKNITFNGVKKTQSEWSRNAGGSPGMVGLRLKSGWSVEKSITTPPTKGLGRHL